MDPQRDRLDEQAPEVVHTDYPEAVQYPPLRTSFQQQHQQHIPKPDDGTGTHASSTTPYSTAYGSHRAHMAAGAAQPLPGDKSWFVGEEEGGGRVPAAGRRTNKNNGKTGLFCGCGTLVVVLCAIIAVLAAAVVGLAAGTGIEANRANIAEAKVSSAMSSAGGGDSSVSPASATMTTATATTTMASVSSAAASSTSFAALDDNCSGDARSVSGTTYNAFSLIGNQTFTIQCNADTVGSPLLSLFTSNLNTCMDACASYTSYTTANFGTHNSNSTCGAVSFIPLWTNKTAALLGGAPGNCYLKPTQTASPNTPNIGTECHSGILNS